MRAFIQGAVSIGLALLALGCRDRPQQPQVSTPEPEWLKAHGRFRQDAAIPFAPIAGEVAPAQPCGPKRRGPCLLLGWEYYNLAKGYTHSAWFLDTEGSEYEFRSYVGAGRGALAEDADPVGLATRDGLVTQDDFANIVAASTVLPRRATAPEVAHALLLLARSQEGPVETIRFKGCNDGGHSTLSGYTFAADRKGWSPVMLEEVSCDFLIKGNASPAARELAQWVHRLRGTVMPYRDIK
jgi:hypothetical protein